MWSGMSMARVPTVYSCLNRWLALLKGQPHELNVCDNIMPTQSTSSHVLFLQLDVCLGYTVIAPSSPDITAARQHALPACLWIDSRLKIGEILGSLATGN